METAKTLIRTVARAFYDVEHVLVIDALMIHSTLRDDDLAHVLGMQVKVLHKLCGKLKEDRLLAVHSRSEIREGMQRPISRTYYFIDYHSTIDAIKYRVHRMYSDIDSQFQPNQEKKDYFCRRCKSRWTQLEVLDNASMEGFNCHKCNFLLEREDETEGDRGGNEKLSRFMTQMDRLLKLLQQIDQEVIPNNTFEIALSCQVAVQRNQLTNPTRPTEAITQSKQPPSAVKGLAQNASQQISVSLANSTETAAELVAEQRKRVAAAEQNKLPEWHTNSTVTGEATALGIKEQAAKIERDANGAAILKEEPVDEKNSEDISGKAALDAYFEALKEEQEKQAKEDLEADESSDEEDEADFEDVGGAGSGTGTPASSMAAADGIKPSLPNGSVKAALGSLGSESGRSTSGPGTPAMGTFEEDGRREAKRARIAGPEKEEEDIKTVTIKVEEEKVDVESDEDEADFEDAL